MAALKDDSSGRRRPSTSHSRSSTSSQSIFAVFPPPDSCDLSSCNSQDLESLVPLKTPLLLATPPAVIRALICSHSYALSLNYFVGLLTWSTSDPYQSFLLLSAFWVSVLYGESLAKSVGPIFPCLLLVTYLCNRRLQSPIENSSSRPGLSRTGSQDMEAMLNRGPAWSNSGSSFSRIDQQPPQRHSSGSGPQKTIEEIIATLQELTHRLNALADPVFEIVNVFAKARKSTGTKKQLFLDTDGIRLVMFAVLWLILTVHPLRIITARRVVLCAGTLVLTWHSQFMRVTRSVLWRSAGVRRLAALATGLSFCVADLPLKEAGFIQELDFGFVKAPESDTNTCHMPQEYGIAVSDTGMKASFTIYENQRRWVGLGWTTNLFSNERSAWTDELNNATRSIDEFKLPDVKRGSQTKWMWSAGSRWTVEEVADVQGSTDSNRDQGPGGWVYYDHKWRNGRRTQGLGTWTRRRKWYRDAELVA